MSLKEDIPHSDIKQEDLEQVGSIAPECLDLKLKYDKCFDKWFEKDYLTKVSRPNMTPCAKQFLAYSKCVTNAIERLDIPVTGFDCPDLMKDEQKTEPEPMPKDK